MIEARQFIGLRLHGGFIIEAIEFTAAPLRDALEREAIAQTTIVGNKFRLLIQADMSDEELSVTLYHEILEAAALAALNPPDALMDFNEAAFERAAREAHARWGVVSPANLNRMLQFHEFDEQ